MKCTLIPNQSITAIIKGKIYTAHKSNELFVDLVQAYKDDDEEAFLKLVTAPKIERQKVVVENYMAGAVTSTGDDFFFQGHKIDNVIVNRIKEFRKEGLPTTALVNFLTKLFQNPSKNSIEQAYPFLEYGNLPIDEDGDFYAYKTVRHDYMDKHSGKFRNMIGDSPSEPRQLISDDPDVACGRGLHVGVLAYSGPTGSFNDRNSDKVMIVKVNPAHIVSVPRDHSAQKMRVEKYLVTGEYTQDLPDTQYGDRETEKEFSVDDLSEGQIVTFFYNKDDQKTFRQLRVIGVDDSHVSGYEESDGGKFKNFLLEKVSCITLLDDNFYDEDENEDEDEEYDDDYHDTFCEACQTFGHDCDGY
jgi:hypothetical protein